MPSRSFRAALNVAGAAFLGLLASCAAPADESSGASPARTGPETRAHETSPETRRIAMPAFRADPVRLEQNLRLLTARPHMAGTDGDRETAEFVREKMLSQGVACEIRSYEVLLPYPVSVSVEMLSPSAFQASLVEEPVREDYDTHDQTAVMPFHAYSPGGDVTAPLVYVNYGRVEDWTRLEEMGVPVRGRIALVRYGKNYRGVKVRLAEERGCKAVIIYSDPADDGFVKGEVYPKGPWRPPTAVQRGSILYSWIRPGDPETPDEPSLPGAARLPLDKIEVLPAIPSVPLSYADAEPLLRSLDGAAVPDGWQGGLPFTYHLGSTNVTTVRVAVTMDWRKRTIWNTLATIPGAELEDEVVLVGNHRDAWVRGAVDPSSGTAVLLEAARLLAEFPRAGHPLKRTVRLATWDAEEFGLIGSTEYGEENAADLDRNAILYVNCDSAVSGPNLGVAGSPSLEPFVENVLESLQDEDGRTTLLDRARGKKDRFTMGLLGGGSDFSVFQNHLMIPCLDVGANGPYGVYHSGFDTFGWMKTQGDRDFRSHAMMARVLAALVFSAAEATVVPFSFESYADAMRSYLDEAEKLDTTLDLGALRGDLDAVKSLAEAVDRGFLAQDLATLSPLVRQSARALAMLERSLVHEKGIPGRPWLKHAVFAPEMTTGYGVTTFPWLKEAILTGDRDAIVRATYETDRVLAGLKARMAALARLLGQGGAESGPSPESRPGAGSPTGK